MTALLKELGVEAEELGTDKKTRWTKKSALANEPQWSKYQNAIFEWIENGSGNLRIDAIAGSGKSTVLSAITTRLSSESKACILAFNKHVAEAMKAKVPSGRVKVSTAHAYGNGLLSQFFGGAPVVDEVKYRKIARELIKTVEIDDLVSKRILMLEFIEAQQEKTPRSSKEKLEKRARSQLIREMSGFLVRLITGCQSTLSDGFVPSLVEMIEFYGIESPPDGANLVLPLVIQALDEGESLAKTQKIIDFGDMLWLVHQWDLQPAFKDFVLIDETQDANMAQLSLYQRLGRESRVVLVGDPSQSIMGFAFSSPKMWDQIRSAFQTADLPLSVCYRCPTSHINLARFFVPQIEAAPAAKEGVLEVLHPGLIKSVLVPGDLVLCRFTAPLIDLCLQLIVKGINAKVRGRDIGTQLVALIDQTDKDLWVNFIRELSLVVTPQIEKLREQMKDEQADSLTDRTLCVTACYEEFGRDCPTLDHFTKKVKDLFTDEDTAITLSTIHRAKGDESDRVFLLSCNSLPYTPKDAKTWQLEQERNIAYVALTRAKKELYLCPVGRDEQETEVLLKSPYGGMGVEAVRLQEKAPDCKPGDLFSTEDGEVFAVERIAKNAVGEYLIWVGGRHFPAHSITPVEPVRHKGKEGFVGYVYSIPWGLPTFRDVIWALPERGGDPVRYSVNDLVFDEAVEGRIQVKYPTIFSRSALLNPTN